MTSKLKFNNYRKNFAIDNLQLHPFVLLDTVTCKKKLKFDAYLMRKLLSAWWIIRVVSVRIVCIIVTILIIVIWIVVLIVIIRPSHFILEEEISWKINGLSFLVLITIVEFIRTHLNFQNLILMLSLNFRQLEYLAENNPAIKLQTFNKFCFIIEFWCFNRASTLFYCNFYIQKFFTFCYISSIFSYPKWQPSEN